jgi:CubicO group peptidase (beta-lactamase class C family)
VTPIRLFLLIGLVAAPSLLQAQHPAPDRVAAVVDSIVAEALEGDRAAGMSVAVERGGELLLNRGYGWAELELAVPTPPDGVYEIGSVTKQFTAAAVLMLAAEGRLDLDADLTDYLPDYPANGRAIPLRRLLDHTSGIRSYTDIPGFWDLSRREVPRDTLVALFASEPFDFEPGEAAIYNNSAYYLLGLIIEEVSGVSYEEYVQESLFGPLEMDRSSYCSERRITPGKVKGYAFTPDGLVHKDPIVHAHPYAAGSLCSSVADLVTWTRALHSGGFPGPELRAGMLRAGELNDGTRLRYGGGLAFTEIRGHPAVHHGGGIPGFLTDLAYLPQQDLIVAVLVNSAGPVSPAGITGQIVEALYGARPLEGVPFAGDLQAFVGRYQGVGRGQPLRAEILTEEGELRIRLGAPQAQPQTLVHLGNDTFGLGTSRFTFEWEDGQVARIRADMGAQYSFLTAVQDEE